ncbi:AAA family ATPase [Aeromonas veronii]
MAFRLKSFAVNSGSFNSPPVLLSKSYSCDNYFTVIIGNNGTGKSRFVSNLVYSFLELNEKRKRAKLEFKLEYQINGEDFTFENSPQNRKFIDERFHYGKPNKLIAIATSLSDKFPVDNYGKSRNFENRLNLKEEFYVYLGTRSRMPGSSTRSLMERAVSTLLQNIHEGRNDERYRDIFDYLNYEPVIKLSYRVYIPEYLSGHVESNNFNGIALKNLLKDWSKRRGGFRADFYQKAVDTYSHSYWDRLAEMYILTLNSCVHESRRPEYSFVVNFSEKNSHRQNTLFHLRQEDSYFLLEELRRYDLVQGPEISLYKIGGGEFDFHDASSGEACILSTLIGLIPNLSDNSLIVIDEPEISLHPSWQYRYIELIDRIIGGFNGCHVIVATHSHFLVSDLPLYRSHVVHFKNNRTSDIDVSYIAHETHGLSAEEILLDVFDMPSTRNYFLSKEVSEALELLAEGKKKSARYIELLEKLERYLPNLKEIDPLHSIIKTLISAGS